VIRDVTRGERSTAGVVITEALMTDPGWNAVVPEEVKRRTALRTLTDIAFRYHASEVPVAVIDSEVAGVAVWVPPGRYPPLLAAGLPVAPRMLGLALRIGGRIRDVALLRDGLAKADAAHEVVYLETSLERNVRLYGRQGFTVMPASPRPLSDGGPVMWRMRRRAK
jgi:hypothetical protein